MGTAAYNRGSKALSTILDHEAEARRTRPSTPRCLCGASTVGGWTGQGVHHGAHRCARVISTENRVEDLRKGGFR